jgi:hypothetical protein
MDIVKAIAEGHNTVKALTKLAGKSRKYVCNRLNPLIASGEVEIESFGVYRVAVRVDYPPMVKRWMGYPDGSTMLSIRQPSVHGAR